MDQGSLAVGIELSSSPTSANDVTVEMEEPLSTVPAVFIGGLSMRPTFTHLTVNGKWKGSTFLTLAADATIIDSRLSTNSASQAPAVLGLGTKESSGLLIQRSVLEAAPKAKPGVLEVLDGNATVDSSEILGGSAGVDFENTAGGTRTLTIAGSTVGAPPGIGVELPGVVGIEAKASGTHASSADVAIEGSIVLQAQVAHTANTGNAVNASCSYSAVPSQIQSADPVAERGAVNCGKGASGNTDVTGEFPTLFAEPLHNFNLNPASSAVDSVPAGAIALPFGFTPSATDLAGNPRVVDGNGDCVAVQDKGALELQGHSAPCPLPGHPPGPVVRAGPPAPAPQITALTIGPGAFFAAPSGATASSAKRRYGAKVSYRDSATATATFTVLQSVAGRRQGHSCHRPSRANRHGGRCKLLVTLGSFTRSDRAGANSFHFSGRLKGRKLRAGAYLLRAVPRAGAGNGTAVVRPFTIR